MYQIAMLGSLTRYKVGYQKSLKCKFLMLVLLADLLGVWLPKEPISVSVYLLVLLAGLLDV